MNEKPIWGTILGISLIIGGCSQPSEESGLRPGQMAIPVAIQPIETRVVEDSSEFVGTLEATQRVILRPEIAGRVVRVFVQNGEQVTPGTPIVQLRPDQQLAQVNSAVAEVNVEQAALLNAQADIKTAESELKTAETERDRAIMQLAEEEANLKLQQEEYKRTEFLVKEGVQPRQQLDVQTRNLQVAIAARNSAYQSLKIAEGNIQTASDRIQAAQATVAEQEAQISQAEANVNEVSEDLRFTRISAPITGQIGDMEVNEGDYVNAGEALTTIIQNNTVELRLEVPVERTDQLQLGLTVELLNEEDQPIARGQISFISPNVAPDAQSILAKATFGNDGTVRDGQFVRARMIWERDRGLLVPTVAVSRIAGQEFVFVAQRDNSNGKIQTIVRQKPVKLGEIQGNYYHVLEGVERGEQIAVSNIQKLRDGVPIQPEAKAQNTLSIQ